jgi:hypothetical protein
MSQNNQSGKLTYLFIGTALAIISSVITTIVSKEYEEYKNQKILFYKINNSESVIDKEKVQEGYYRKFMFTLAYAGRGTASFSIYFVPKEGCSISSAPQLHLTPEELPPSISKGDSNQPSEYRYYITSSSGRDAPEQMVAITGIRT